MPCRNTLRPAIRRTTADTAMSLWMLKRTRHTDRPPTTVKIYRAVWACSLPKVSGRCRGRGFHPGDEAQRRKTQGLGFVIRVSTIKNQCMSQQEDDLRALAKIMDFLRAVSIILVVMNVLVLLRSHPAVGREHRCGGQNPSELRPHGGAVPFHSLHETVSVLCFALSCLGTKGVKGEKIALGRIWTAFAVGFVLFS